ncbi:MAG: (4Fe-4S)-binding protein [Flavobacteriales bacterium]|nr:(4Fe-4S)-binding protein [Flavobacteriales bacterium]
MTKEYEKDDITVVWKKELCVHAAKCAKGLPAVFKPKDRPWIQTEGATKEEIINQVHQCPSGALSIKGE